jgi:hypothetical protein
MESNVLSILSGSSHEFEIRKNASSSEYPDASVWTMMGGSDGVVALINDLYRRIEQHELLRVAFPHFDSGEATGFFMQWFGELRSE